MKKVLLYITLLLSLTIPKLYALHKIGLQVKETLIVLNINQVNYRFTKQNNKWAFQSVSVADRPVFKSVSRDDGFFLKGGEAASFTVLKNSQTEKEIRFTRIGTDNATAVFSVSASDVLPKIVVRFENVTNPTSSYITANSNALIHGAWATRGETASDEENKEVFIDGSGPFVFGHSTAGDIDAAYVVQAFVNDYINPKGRSEQKSDTYFKSGQIDVGNGEKAGYFQLKMGINEPKKYAVVFDKNLGGRFHNVCEKYYADVVDSQVDLAAYVSDYDANLAVQKMPIRLSTPESLIPGVGWHMQEYGNAAYPFGYDSGIQTGALLIYEGLATGRDWEKNFGKYVLDKTPLWGTKENPQFFVDSPGGITRWGYTSDYKTKFPLLEGGNWTSSEQLYKSALISGDVELKRKALQLMLHDVNVKLDLKNMFFPPCWNPLTSSFSDHRDDWNITVGLAYCAELCTEILYPETKDKAYLRKADSLTNWLASYWGPEKKMNFLHKDVNTIHCFSGWLIKAMIHRYERDHNKQFLNIGKDLAWVLILCNAITPHKDSNGNPLVGVTCVGVRGCVDYDCTPNLCHEKDLVFLDMMGPLAKYIQSPGYAKYISMQALVLPRDSWKDAFGIQEQRNLNLRTNYDNYARGMTNLSFAINIADNKDVKVFERLVSLRDETIRTNRDMIISNATTKDQIASIKINYLKQGEYQLWLDNKLLGRKRNKELEAGIKVITPKNSIRKLVVKPVALQKLLKNTAKHSSASFTYLSDLKEMEVQRGVGLADPTFVKDQSFNKTPLVVNGQFFKKGLGLAANTVLVYNLGRGYKSLSAMLAMNDDVKTLSNPAPSVNVSIFADGKVVYESGAFTASSEPSHLHISLENVDVLTIRVSGNWDDEGKTNNDLVNLIDAKLIGGFQ